jgi:hypothetical protein
MYIHEGQRGGCHSMRRIAQAHPRVTGCLLDDWNSRRGTNPGRSTSQKYNTFKHVNHIIYMSRCERSNHCTSREECMIPVVTSAVTQCLERHEGIK